MMRFDRFRDKAASILRQIAVLPLAIVLLHGCADSNEPTKPIDNDPVNAEDTVLTYADIRSLLAEDYAVGPDGKFISSVVEEKFQNFAVAPMFRGCAYGLPGYNAPFGIGAAPEIMSESGEVEEPPPGEDGSVGFDSIEETATIDIQISSYLRRLGVPANIYEAPLRKWAAASRSGDPKAYEMVPLRFDYRLGSDMPAFETEIARLDGELIEGINANIDKAGLQETIWLEPDEGCGAGDVPYRIQTTPPKSVASVIQTTFFKLCRARKIDPYDKSKCDGWKDLRDGQLAFMAGDYQWSIKSEGAAEKRGKLSLFGGEMDDEIPLKIGD